MSTLWKESEVEALENAWGVIPVPQLSKQLGRTVKGILYKAYKMGLSPYTESDGRLGPKEVADIIGVHTKTVIKWSKHDKLKAHKVSTTNANKRIYRIKLDDLMKWLEANQDRWDSRKVELYSLGQEPEWLKKKRKADANKRHREWTKEETMQFEFLYKRDVKRTEIAKILNRTPNSIYHKINIYRARIGGI